MNSPHSHRRPQNPRKIRRTGRHAKPSQVQNVAGTAYKAAPAMAIAGALIAAPSAHAAQVPARATTIAELPYMLSVVWPVSTSQIRITPSRVPSASRLLAACHATVASSLLPDCVNVRTC